MTGTAPLAGLRVLDLSRLIPGAAVTHYFADYGADVVKVEEPPVGDYLRDVKPDIDGVSVQALTLDRGKRSIALPLRTPEGQAVLHELVASADALVVVSAQAAMRSLAADWETVRERNPRLVYLSYTGFGTDSPYAQLPTHGSNLACFAGVHGYEIRDDDGIVPAALTYGRYRISMEQASLHAAFVLLAALRERDRTGQARFVDLTITDALMTGDYAAMGDWVNNGRAYMAEQQQPAPRYALYRAGDGLVLMVCPIEERFWRAFCEVLDRPDLLVRGDWSGNQMDFATGDAELYHEIQQMIATRTRAAWLDLLVAARVPCAPANTIDEAVADPHLGGRLWITTEHPVTGRPVRQIGPLDPAVRSTIPRSAPSLGQDTEEVLEAYGVSADGREGLRTGVAT